MPKSDVKQSQVRRSIVSDIVSGKLAPGARLPTYEEMQSGFSVSFTTLHLAVQDLKRDGYLVGVGRVGLFASEMPPHLHRYALVVQAKRNERDNLFVETVVSLACGWPGQESFIAYRNFEPHVDNPDFQRLLSDVEARRVGGVIFIGLSDPRAVLPSELFELPTVTVSQCACASSVRVSCDHRSFARKALDCLQAKGRRKVAALFYGAESLVFEHLQEEMRLRGLPLNPDWLVKIGSDVCESAAPVTRLIFGAPRRRRPDALIVADDNLTEPALTAILGLRLEIPVDLDVVVHCNWPVPARPILPVVRIGYDARRLIEESVSIFKRHYSRRPAEGEPGCVLLEALREDELGEAAPCGGNAV